MQLVFCNTCGLQLSMRPIFRPATPFLTNKLTVGIKRESISIEGQRLIQLTKALSLLQKCLRNAKVGIMRFSKLLVKKMGFFCTMRTMSVVEAPFDVKNWNLGKNILWVSHKIRLGSLVDRWVIWGSEKPWFLKKLKAASGFCGVSNWTVLETLNADCKENPKLLTRYDTVKEGLPKEEEEEEEAKEVNLKSWKHGGVEGILRLMIPFSNGRCLRRVKLIMGFRMWKGLMKVSIFTVKYGKRKLIQIAKVRKHSALVANIWLFFFDTIYGFF